MGSCKELESMLQVPSQRVKKSLFYTAENFWHRSDEKSTRTKGGYKADISDMLCCAQHLNNLFRGREHLL